MTGNQPAPQRILEATTLGGGPYPVPAHPTDPTNPDPTKWAAFRCNYKTLADGEIEWSPVLTNDETGGDVGMSGTVVQVMFDDADNDFTRDLAFTHPFYNDYRCQVVPDDPYMSMLAPGNLDPSDDDWKAAAASAQSLGISAPGFLELEIDRGLLPADYRPQLGDRVAVLGRWIVDCGHPDFSTETHPPLLLAAARAASDDQTSVTLMSRAFLVSQYYDGKPLIPYFTDKVVALEVEAVLLGPLVAALPPIEARPNLVSPPFSGIQIFGFVVRPPRPRNNPSERLLLSYHFVTRSGVSVDVGAGQDEVTVFVTMNDVAYEPTAEPPKHDITVPLDALRNNPDVKKAIGLIEATNPLTAPVLEKGIVTTRFDMPAPASSEDQVNVVQDVLVNRPGGVPGGVPRGGDQPVDDTQPYPIYGWISLRYAPSNSFTSDVSPAASGSGNNTVVVAKSPDGRILYNWWPLGRGGMGWQELDGAGRTDAAPAAALVGDNHDYLFAVVKGLDGNIYLNQGNLGQGFVGWQPMDFQTDVAPAAAGSGNNTVVVAKSPDGRILYNWWPLGRGGMGWQELDGAGRTDAAPAAALVGDNHDYLFAVVKGLDGNIYLNQGNLGQGFVGWQPMDFQTDVAPAAAGSGNNTVVVAKSPDGRILYNWWPLGRGGMGWQELDGAGRTDAAPAAALVGDNHDYLFAVVKGLDGNIYLNQGNLGQGFVGWQPMDFQTDVAPAAAGSGNNTVVVAKSPDGRILYNWWPL